MSSADLTRHGDPTVRARDDLYAHVNGHFQATAVIADDRPGAGLWFELHDRVRRDLDHLVARVGTGHRTGSPEQLVGDFYTSFTDVPRLAAQGDEPLRALLAEALDFSTPRGLSERLGLLARHQLDSALHFDVVSDPADDGRMLPRFSAGGIGLGEVADHLAPDRAGLRDSYQQHISRMCALLDLPDPDALAAGALQIETELAELQADAETERDLSASWHPMTYEAVQHWTRNLAWLPLLHELDLAADQDPVLVIAQPAFVLGLDRLMERDRMPEWRGWVAWRVIRGLADYGPPALAAAHWRFEDVTLAGQPSPLPRQQRALAQVEHYLGDAMGQLYVARHFPARAATGLTSLVETIVGEYRTTLEHVGWLTTPARREALTKLARLGVRVGHPQRWHDYSSLRIEPDDLLGNALRAASHLTETAVDRLVGLSDADDWRLAAHSLNAYYDLGSNEIFLPAAFAQPPLFDPDADPALNYGAIGSIIAHEISHAFDDRGSQVDASGRLRDWWTPADRANFDDLKRRFIASLDAIESPDLPGAQLRGELCVGEAMSDLGGLAVAFRAWRRADPDADESAAQRFFLAHAGIWRHVERPDEARFRLATDPHPPAQVRCNWTARNFEGFHAAFGTRPGDGMWLRPGLRLSLW